MDNRREKNIMEFNQSEKLSSTSRPVQLQMHDFMPMPASTLHDKHQREEAKISYFMNHLKQNMQIFWKDRLAEICEAPGDVRGPNTLPLARIKKVMKSDEQVKMISADTPVVFAKACEMFIMELTLRAWMHTQENKRRTLQRNDVADAIRDEDLLLFLEDIVPMEIHREAALSQANYPGVYVPHPHTGNPTQPIYPVNMQSINQAAYFTRIQEIQQGPVNPQPPPTANGANPYFGFK